MSGVSFLWRCDRTGEGAPIWRMMADRDLDRPIQLERETSFAYTHYTVERARFDGGEKCWQAIRGMYGISTRGDVALAIMDCENDFTRCLNALAKEQGITGINVTIREVRI